MACLLGRCSAARRRQGLKVCLLESGPVIGGIMTTCPGMPIGAAYPNGMSIGGILDEYLKRLYTMNPPAAEKRKCRLAEFGPEVFYDHEIAIFSKRKLAVLKNRILKPWGLRWACVRQEDSKAFTA